MDEMQGTRIRDLSIYGNHGTLTNAANPPTPTSGWGAGASQRELAFDGADDYVTVPHVSAMNITGDLSIGVWVRLATVGGNYSIFGKRTGAGAANYLIWAFGSTLSYFDGSVRNSTYTITAGVPFYALVTKKGALMNWYVNGSFVSQQAVTDPAPTNTDPFLMGRDSSGQYTPCRIQHGRLYNRALSAVEGAQIYADRWIGAI